MRFFTNEEDAIMMPSLYECLPEFCYYYGRISHAYKETEIMPKEEKVENFGHRARLKAAKNKQDRSNRGGESPVNHIGSVAHVKIGNPNTGIVFD